MFAFEIRICICVYVCAHWTYSICIPACVCMCAPLLCTHAIGVEVIPFGLFNRHQLSFVLQEMDAADYYPRIHKFFMCKLKLYGLMNSVCETVQAKCPSTPQPTPPSRSMVKIKRCIFFFSVFCIFILCFPVCHAPVCFHPLPTIFGLSLFSRTQRSKLAVCALIPPWECW